MMMWQVLPWEGRVVSAVSRLLGSAGQGIEVQYDQLFFQPSRVGEGTAFHTDNAYFKLKDPRAGVAMWIAADDSTVENGTLHVAPWHPGKAEPTHGHDRKQHGHELEISARGAAASLLAEASACTLPAGGVAFFCYGVPLASRAVL